MKLTEGFQLLATAPDGVAHLRDLVLSLAVQGELVPQNRNDESAGILLETIAQERDRLGLRGKSRGKARRNPQDQLVMPNLPQGWEWTSLAEIGLINPRNVADDDQSASFVQMSSIPTALVVPHSTEERSWSDIKSGFTHFAEGDVGVAKITPCFENGKSTVFRNLTNGIGAGTTELHVVRPLGGISPDYVLIFLKTSEFLRNGESVMTGSAGQKRLPRDYFENTPFPLPPLSEQTRIVAKVVELMRLCDELENSGHLEAEQHARLTATLFEALAASESAHDLAENWSRVAANFDLLLDRPEAVDALEQTILQLAVRGLLIPQDPNDETVDVLFERAKARKVELVQLGQAKRGKPLAPIAEEEIPFTLPDGWKWARLSDLLSKLGAGSTPLGGKEVYVPSGVKFLRSQNVWNEGLRLDGVAYITPETHARMAGTVVAPGDLLFNITGASIGRCAVVPSEFDEANVSQHVAIVRPLLEEITPYLHLVLISRHVQQTVMDVQVGVSREGLSMSKLGLFVIPVPPVEEQARIVARVAELRQLCADLRTRLTNRQTGQARFAEALVGQTAATGPDERSLELAA